MSTTAAGRPDAGVTNEQTPTIPPLPQVVPPIPPTITREIFEIMAGNLARVSATADRRAVQLGILGEENSALRDVLRVRDAQVAEAYRQAEAFRVDRDRKAGTLQEVSDRLVESSNIRDELALELQRERHRRLELKRARRKKGKRP